MVIEVFDTKIIPNSGGNVRKFVDNNTKFLENFGEIYFSEIKKNHIKGWKCHLKFFCHICVPVGAVRFVFQNSNKTRKDFINLELTSENLKLVKIHPNTWFAFQGLGDGINLVANVLSGVHDPHESISKALSEVNYRW